MTCHVSVKKEIAQRVVTAYTETHVASVLKLN